jgi:hypothetical protein
MLPSLLALGGTVARNDSLPSAVLQQLNGTYRIAFFGQGFQPGGGNQAVHGSYFIFVNDGKISDYVARGSGSISLTGAINDTASYQAVSIHVQGKVHFSHGLSAGGQFTGSFDGVSAHGTWNAAKVNTM